jgi:hypothetical protein
MKIIIPLFPHYGRHYSVNTDTMVTGWWVKKLAIHGKPLGCMYQIRIGFGRTVLRADKVEGGWPA